MDRELRKKPGFAQSLHNFTKAHSNSGFPARRKEF
jgi:hypothetical protein